MNNQCVGRASIVLLITLINCLNGRPAEGKLVAYWPLDTRVLDRVADARADLVGDVVSVPGYIGNALELRGDSAYIELPIGRLLESLTDFSIAMWVNSTGEEGYWARLFDFGSGTRANMYLTSRSIFSESIFFQMTKHGYQKGEDLLPLYRLPKGWHHIVVALDSSSHYVMIYADGALVGEKEVLLTVKDLGAVENAWLGKSHHSGDPFFTGVIDEVAIFDHALKQQEVRTLYRSSAEAFVQKGGTALAQGLKQAVGMMEGGEPGRAVHYLEGMIADQERAKKAPGQGGNACTDAVLAETWSLLARGRELSNSPVADVAEAYANAAGLAPQGSLLIDALLGVYEHSSVDDYQSVARDSLDGDAMTTAHLPIVTEKLRAHGDWQAFKLFLDVLFSEVPDQDLHALAIGQLLADTLWSSRFEQYCQEIARDAPFHVGIAETFARIFRDRGDFEKAIHIYRDLSRQSEQAQDKIRYEAAICENLFLSGQYREAEAMADALMETNDATSVSQAYLLKGQILMSMGDLQNAMRYFSEIGNASVNTDHRARALYLTGYCNYLQKDHVKSKEALDQLQRTFPESPLCQGARMLLSCIENGAQ